MTRIGVTALGLLAITSVHAQEAGSRASKNAEFGSVITEGLYDGGLDTRGLALADTYLGQSTYPSPDGLWLHNSRLQVSGDTFGFGHNSTLAVLCANQGPNCDAGTQGSFWDFGYRRVYGQEDAGVIALMNTEVAPLVDHAVVSALTGDTPGHHRIFLKEHLSEAVFSPRKTPPDGLFMHPQLAAMTSNCFMGYIVSWDPAGWWVDIDNWSRGAGNSCGGSVESGRTPDVQPGAELTVTIGSLTAGVGLIYGVANTVDNRMSRGAEFGEFTFSNSRTPDIHFSQTDPTGDEMDIGDGLGAKPFIDWGFMLGTSLNKQHRYAAGTAMLTNGDWYRAFANTDPAGDGAFIDMPRGGGNDEGASFRSYRLHGDVLICAPPGQMVTCKLDHAGNLKLAGNFALAGRLSTDTPIQLATLAPNTTTAAGECTPGALAYQPGRRVGGEAPGHGTGAPVFCNDLRTWVTLNSAPVTR